MRNRPDISYLTIIGLSLTVVIAMQKGDSCQDSVKFKLSDADGHHVYYLSADAARNAFLAVSTEKSSFVFGQNLSSFVRLKTPIKVLVYGKEACFADNICPVSIIPIENHTREQLPDFYGSVSLPLNHRIKLPDSNLGNNSQIVSKNLIDSFSYPVRAGPSFFI
jgi:hypothetical protein